jgi:hypothetical protein
MSAKTIAPIDPAPAPAIFGLVRDPQEILKEAVHAANVLLRVIEASPARYIQMIGTSKHLRFEAWQTIGTFFGYVASNEWARPVISDGKVAAYQARALVKRVTDGAIISAAEALCGRDEAKWHTRPKYEWHYILKDGTTAAEEPPWDKMVWEPGPNGKRRPRKIRVRVGEELVPEYQLNSMAQTRAAGKALRFVLSWVVVLAGFDPTPAEEMTDVIDVGEAEEERPTPTSPGPTPATGATPASAAATPAGPASAPAPATAPATASAAAPQRDQAPTASRADLTGRVNELRDALGLTKEQLRQAAQRLCGKTNFTTLTNEEVGLLVKELARLNEARTALGLTSEQLGTVVRRMFDKGGLADLTNEEAALLIKELEEEDAFQKAVKKEGSRQ